MESESASARRYAAGSGLAVALLFGGGNAIWGLDMPDGGTPVPELLDFYRETADRIIVGASLSLLAIAAFVLFAAAVRQVLIEAGGDEVLATAAFGGAVLVSAAGLGAETINMVGALRARGGELNAALAQSLFEISQVLGSVASGIGLGVFAVATATVALRTTRILPRGISLVTLAVGLLLLTPLSAINLVPGAALVLITASLGVAFRRPRPGDLSRSAS